jgi:two-component system, OmpR family, sensor histidine kinase VicK
LASDTRSNIHSSHSDVQRINIVYGIQNIATTYSQLYLHAEIKIDNCINCYNLLSYFELESIKQSIIEAKSRGVLLRYLTEITKDNIKYCKEFAKIVDELRHLDGLKSNFVISESQYIAIPILEKSQLPTQIIYSNINPIVQQIQGVFNTFWYNAIPAEQKIKEIEEGEGHYGTKILENQEEIINKIIHLAETSSQLLIVSSYGGMQLIYNNFLSSYKKLLNENKKIEGKGIKWICNIEKQTLEIVKIFLDMGMQIRHVKNLPPMSFALGNREINATIEKMEHGKMVQSLLTSYEPLYVKHFLSIFEDLWNSGMDATNRIIELEEGIDLEGIKIIRNPVEVQKLAFDLLKSAEDEILIIFSTANAFHRQEKAGSIELLTEIASKKGSINIKIMTPIDDKLKDIKKGLENIETNEKVKEKKEKIVDISREKSYKLQKSNKIEIRFIESQQQTTISILIVDRKYCLAVELKDDTKATTYEAIGLATYSNSKSTVLSYISMFETLWLQTELYDRLKVHDKIQKDFINVAAHELRTPIQPIIAITDIIYSKSKGDKENRELLEIILRNAKRLKRLTDDILDVAKIESQSLQTQKEWFNLEDVIASLVSQYKTNIKEIDYIINLNFIREEKNLFIKADKGRITQVLDNLLCNAIRFTEGRENGSITITAKRERNDSIKVITKDTGIGIDKEILSRLFTKFATKSDKGTGLGLYISKKIIEAHNGKIWGKNNDNDDENGIGAEFGFILPIE